MHVHVSNGIYTPYKDCNNSNWRHIILMPVHFNECILKNMPKTESSSFLSDEKKEKLLHMFFVALKNQEFLSILEKKTVCLQSRECRHAQNEMFACSVPVTFFPINECHCYNCATFCLCLKESMCAPTAAKKRNYLCVNLIVIIYAQMEQRSKPTCNPYRNLSFALCS